MASPNINSSARQALPLYDLFLDIPHPASAAGCPPPFILGGPANSPEMESELSANLSRIAAFAFPEFDDSVAQRIPRDSALNRFSQYAMQPKGFQNYTFSLQLQSGVRVHGFVRRYLPIHPVAKHRYDVGRRGERALVILTRYSGGDLLYAAILKTMDAITYQGPALDGKNPHAEPQKWFLHHLFDEHRKLCAEFSSLPMQEKMPMTLTVAFAEAGNKPLALLHLVDTTKFMIPTCLLASTSVVEALTSSSILPLLRVLGVSSTLRLVSALLSEDRVLLVSASPTRLAQCARSALSILAQGLLNWQHLYIPVLPPHLFQYLAAPVPYLIGMLTTLVPKMDQAAADGLGEMVIINLDTCQMETRGMNATDVPTKVPDLFRQAVYEQGMPASSMSSSEMLAQDLVDLLKVDKRALHGESTLSNVSETAAKATQAVKSGITKLARKGKNFFNNRLGNNLSDTASGPEDETVDSGDATDEAPGAPQNTLLPDFIYTQGSQNEIAEEEARIAFTSFFLSLFGNMRWYLSASPGKLPQLDRQRFLQQKRAMGEGEHTPMWPLLQNFCHTQMLEQFAKARVEEVRLRVPVSSDSPLFTQCANYHRLHSIDFSVVNVRRVSRQVAQNNPSRLIVQTSARRTAMLLTSNRSYEGDYNFAVAELVEQCRESTSVLFDVMSVVWVRMRDSKGLHWKHGFQALQILRNLLYHGPLAAIAEATDGLDKIRAMKFYNDNMRSQICTQIRQAASQVYNLLVDRAKLFNIRRLCINKRRVLRKPEHGRYVRDTRLDITIPFNRMHPLMNPKVNARVAPAPSSAHPSGVQLSANQDLLGLTSTTTGAVVSGPPSGNVVPADDLMGLFGNVSISDAGQPTAGNQPSAPSSGGYDPFAHAPPPTMQAQNLIPTQQPVAPAMHAAVTTPMQAPQQTFPMPFQQPTSYGAPQQQPQQNPYGAPPQQYQQHPPPGWHPPAQVAGYPGVPQGGYGGPPPSTQQVYQPSGHPHYPQQQHQIHHPSYQQQQQPQYPPQFQHQLPPGQPAKPNISQFDPFK